MKKAVIFLLVFILLTLSACTKQAYNPKSAEESSSKKEETIQKEEVKEGKLKKAETATETIAEIKKTPKSFLNEKEYLNIPSDKIYYRDRAVVLTYHHISPKPPTGITITPERFEKDIKMLKENYFSIISNKDMADCIEGKGKFPPNAVVISFDDGYMSFYKYAYPVLLKYNVPAVNFVITHWMETFTPSGKEFDLLTPEVIKEMYESGLVDIQSHSHDSHHYIIKDKNGNKGGMLAYQIYDQKTGKYESEEEYKKRVVEDLKKSIEVIEKYTGQKSDTLCFPFGHYNSRLVELGKQAGFQYFVTTVYGNVKENSKNNIIYRIRSGDTELNTEKLKENIINCGRGKPLSQPKPATQ